jgi:hypothetical protein
MTGCKLPHKRLTVEQSAQVHKALEELKPVTERAGAAIYGSFHIVDGQQNLVTGKITGRVYEICPESIKELAPTLRALAELYEDLARYCGVDAKELWEPNGKST